jgi:hypothetical protein
MSITPREQVPKELPAGEFGLLANGSSRLWDVAVDESLEQEGALSLEFDGPALYLVLRLRDLAVIPEAVDFLQRLLSAAESTEPRQRTVDGDTLSLGSFNSSPVLLIADDELPARCFVVIGPEAKSTMRLTLQREDVEMILNALRQLAADLPRDAK